MSNQGLVDYPPTYAACQLPPSYFDLFNSQQDINVIDDVIRDTCSSIEAEHNVPEVTNERSNLGEVEIGQTEIQQQRVRFLLPETETQTTERQGKKYSLLFFALRLD